MSEDAVVAAAARLAGTVPTHVSRVGHRGNSRVYRVDTGGATYALKRYPAPRADDPRDRAGTERRALTFLRAGGVTSVPRWFAGEPGFGLLEWIEGHPTTDPDRDDVRAAVDFIAAITPLSINPEAWSLPLASEACLSGAELVRQVQTKLDRLRREAAPDPELEDFLDAVFAPAFAQREAAARQAYAAAELDFSRALTQDRQSLIPADFGFHNTLRRACAAGGCSDSNDTRRTHLAFVDFEYFGWDDPAKLVADALLHPGTRLSDDARVMMDIGLRGVFDSDPDVARRLDALFPCFGLRWALILLNVFLPGYIASRQLAPTAADRHVQLSKAAQMLDASRAWHVR